MNAFLVKYKTGYPDPPVGIAVDADAETMLFRYSRYRQGRDTLAGMAYFCLTVLEHSAGNRAVAAAKYYVSETVLRTLGRLTGEKGGTDARKSEGRAQDFTPAECRWVEEAVKKLIRRAAELAYGTQSPSGITMIDLPRLK